MEEKNKIVIDVLPGTNPIDWKLTLIPMAVCVRCRNEVDRSDATVCRHCNGIAWQLTNRLGNR